MNCTDKRIALQVDHRARLALLEAMTPEQRRALRNWVDRAAAYRVRFPDAPLDEVRAAVRALRSVPMTDYAQAGALVSEGQARDEIERICAEIRRQHTEETQP